MTKRLEKISNTKDMQEKANILTKFINAMYELKERLHKEEGETAVSSLQSIFQCQTVVTDSVVDTQL